MSSLSGVKPSKHGHASTSSGHSNNSAHQSTPSSTSVYSSTLGCSSKEAYYTTPQAANKQHSRLHPPMSTPPGYGAAATTPSDPNANTPMPRRNPPPADRTPIRQVSLEQMQAHSTTTLNSYGDVTGGSWDMSPPPFAKTPPRSEGARPRVVSCVLISPPGHLGDDDSDDSNSLTGYDKRQRQRNNGGRHEESTVRHISGIAPDSRNGEEDEHGEVDDDEEEEEMLSLQQLNNYGMSSHHNQTLHFRDVPEIATTSAQSALRRTPGANLMHRSVLDHQTHSSGNSSSSSNVALLRRTPGATAMHRSAGKGGAQTKPDGDTTQDSSGLCGDTRHRNCHDSAQQHKIAKSSHSGMTPGLRGGESSNNGGVMGFGLTLSTPVGASYGQNDSKVCLHQKNRIVSHSSSLLSDGTPNRQSSLHEGLSPTDDASMALTIHPTPGPAHNNRHANTNSGSGRKNSRPPLNPAHSAGVGRESYVYTPAARALAKNPHLQLMNHPDGLMTTNGAFSPNTVRLTENLDNLLHDDDDDGAATSANDDELEHGKDRSKNADEGRKTKQTPRLQPGLLNASSIQQHEVTSQGDKSSPGKSHFSGRGDCGDFDPGQSSDMTFSHEDWSDAYMFDTELNNSRQDSPTSLESDLIRKSRRFLVDNNNNRCANRGASRKVKADKKSVFGNDDGNSYYSDDCNRPGNTYHPKPIRSGYFQSVASCGISGNITSDFISPPRPLNFEASGGGAFAPPSKQVLGGNVIGVGHTVTQHSFERRGEVPFQAPTSKKAKDHQQHYHPNAHNPNLSSYDTYPYQAPTKIEKYRGDRGDGPQQIVIHHLHHYSGAPTTLHENNGGDSGARAYIDAQGQHHLLQHHRHPPDQFFRTSIPPRTSKGGGCAFPYQSHLTPPTFHNAHHFSQCTSPVPPSISPMTVPLFQYANVAHDLPPGMAHSYSLDPRPFTSTSQTPVVPCWSVPPHYTASSQYVGADADVNSFGPRQSQGQALCDEVGGTNEWDTGAPVYNSCDATSSQNKGHGEELGHQLNMLSPTPPHPHSPYPPAWSENSDYRITDGNSYNNGFDIQKNGPFSSLGSMPHMSCKEPCRNVAPGSSFPRISHTQQDTGYHADGHQQYTHSKALTDQDENEDLIQTDRLAYNVTPKAAPCHATQSLLQTNFKQEQDRNEDVRPKAPVSRKDRQFRAKQAHRQQISIISVRGLNPTKHNELITETVIAHPKCRGNNSSRNSNNFLHERQSENSTSNKFISKRVEKLSKQRHQQAEQFIDAEKESGGTLKPEASEERSLPITAVAIGNSNPVDEAAEMKRAELVESPVTRLAFKDFYRKFRLKERISFQAAEAFAIMGLKNNTLPAKIHWRVYLELADLAKRANQFDEARKLYQKVCQTQPYATQGWLEYSKLEEECGELSKCSRLLHEGLSYCEYNENLLTRAIKHEERAGDLSRARHLLARLKHVGIEKTWRTVLEGALLEARAGNTHMSRRVLKYLMHHVPWYGPLYLEAYRLERDSDRPMEALAVVERGLKEIPRYGPLWFVAFRLCEGLDLERNDFCLPRTMNMVERATVCISRELIWKVQLDAAQSQERAAHLAVKENVDLLLDECLNACRTRFAKTILACPDNLCWKVWLIGGRMELSAGMTYKARKLFLRSFEIVPEKGRATVLLECARLEEFGGDLELTRAILCKARAEAGSDWKVWLESVSFEIRNSMRVRAISMVHDALIVHCGTGRLWAALVQLRQPDGEEVQTNAFKGALNAVPKSGEVWCEGARILMNPFAPTFDLATSARYLGFATKFTPQYGDSFLETLRFELIQKWIVPAALHLINGMEKALSQKDVSNVALLNSTIRHCARGAVRSIFSESDMLALNLSAVRSVDTSDLELCCSNADPNYGKLWFHCRDRPTDTARTVLRRAKDVIGLDLIKYAHIYIVAMMRRAGTVLALRIELGGELATVSNNDDGVIGPTCPRVQEGSKKWDELLQARLRSAPTVLSLLGERQGEEDMPFLESGMSGSDFVTGLVELNRQVSLKSLSFTERRNVLFGSDLLL